MASGPNLLMNMFGRPRGIIGRLGGVIMARMNADCGVWVAGLLEVTPGDAVLEIGFGPGVIIQCLSKLASGGYVAGIDPSPEMVEQALARNAIAIKDGRVDLRRGSVESLPFADNIFDKALAINSMQVWPDAATGLRAVRRVMRPGGRIALGLYALFRAAEPRTRAGTHCCWLCRGACEEEKYGLLCTRSKADRNLTPEFTRFRGLASAPRQRRVGPAWPSLTVHGGRPLTGAVPAVHRRVLSR